MEKREQKVGEKKEVRKSRVRTKGGEKKVG